MDCIYAAPSYQTPLVHPYVHTLNWSHFTLWVTFVVTSSKIENLLLPGTALYPNEPPVSANRDTISTIEPRIQAQIKSMPGNNCVTGVPPKTVVHNHVQQISTTAAERENLQTFGPKLKIWWLDWSQQAEWFAGGSSGIRWWSWQSFKQWKLCDFNHTDSLLNDREQQHTHSTHTHW